MVRLPLGLTGPGVITGEIVGEGVNVGTFVKEVGLVKEVKLAL